MEFDTKKYCLDDVTVRIQCGFKLMFVVPVFSVFSIMDFIFQGKNRIESI